MKLYEINARIEELLEQLEPDPETGEVPSDYDEILNRIHALSMRREDILEYIAKLALNAKTVFDPEIPVNIYDLGSARISAAAWQA